MAVEPLKCWGRAKELRRKYYESYVKAHERGGIRWAGSAWAPHSLPAGLGDDVHSLTGEPYGASVAVFPDFCARCEDTVDRAGIARDLCAYLRNYWGAVLLDKFILPDGTIIDEFPKPDFYLSSHICCSHAKWYQYAAELEGGVPLYAIDTGLRLSQETSEASIEYLVQQLNEAILWMEKVTQRKWSAELFIEALRNDLTSQSLWSEICFYNQAIPAPLEEKTMYSLYVFNTLSPHRKEVVDFYKELRDEIKDRVERGIGAVPNEKFRIMHDGQPPWAFLRVFRYMEQEYGVISVASLYTCALANNWDVLKDGTLVPVRTPWETGISPKTRDEALRLYAMYNWEKRIIWYTFASCRARSDFVVQMAKQWKAQAVIIHLNRGCEGTAFGQMQIRLALIKADIPVLTYEGNMADSRDFDLPRTISRIDAFLESLGLERLSQGA